MKLKSIEMRIVQRSFASSRFGAILTDSKSETQMSRLCTASVNRRYDVEWVVKMLSKDVIKLISLVGVLLVILNSGIRSH